MPAISRRSAPPLTLRSAVSHSHPPVPEPSAPWPRAALFDLDGTLIDSAPDIAASVNTLLARHALGPLTLDQVKSMIGHGIEKTVERAFAACGRPMSPADLAARNAEMVDIYADNLTNLTVLMPGAREAIESLHRQGVRLAVATNKPQRASEIVLGHFGLTPFLDCAIGGDTGVKKKPAPDILLAALERLGVEAREAVMVGDSGADVESAKAAGIVAVAVRGGYVHAPIESLGADAVIASLHQLPEALEEFRKER